MEIDIKMPVLEEKKLLLRILFAKKISIKLNDTTRIQDVGAVSSASEKSVKLW